MRLDGYQTDDLEQALAELQDYLEGQGVSFAFSVEFTGRYEGTVEYGSVPTVKCSLEI